MARSTADALNIVCRLDHDGKLDEVAQDKKQEVATSILCDKLQTQDFAGPSSLWASKVLGPISRYRVADILLHMKLASRTSRPGLTVGFLRMLCNGLCTAQRFHTEDYEQICRVGCPNEADSLSHYNECPFCMICFRSFWKQATELPRRNHLLHDLITHVFLRSLQYGIVVMGFIDAFVYAHHQHRQGSEYPGIFGVYMKGRIRFMTTIIPSHAPCISGNMSIKTHAGYLRKKIPSPEAQRKISVSSQYSFHTHAKESMISMDGSMFLDGSSRCRW